MRKLTTGDTLPVGYTISRNQFKLYSKEEIVVNL